MYEEKDAIIKYDDGRCDKATKGDKLVVEERRDAADVRSGWRRELKGKKLSVSSGRANQVCSAVHKRD